MLDNLLKLDPFSINRKEKNKIFTDQIRSLTFHHYQFCKKYKKIIKNLNSVIWNFRKRTFKNLFG